MNKKYAKDGIGRNALMKGKYFQSVAKQIRCQLAMLLAVFLLVGLNVSSAAQTLGEFQRVETQTLDKQKFVFPDDMQADGLIIAMLAMSSDQDNGEWQGEMLLKWYQALESEGVLSGSVRAYHFSVMKVPFFVKGLVRGGLADSYKGKVPADQAAAIFIKDLQGFAAAPGIELDGKPSLVLVAPNGSLLEVIKGEPTDENVALLEATVDKYSQGD